jgi:hypothetical protein
MAVNPILPSCPPAKPRPTSGVPITLAIATPTLARAIAATGPSGAGRGSGRHHVRERDACGEPHEERRQHDHGHRTRHEETRGGDRADDAADGCDAPAVPRIRPRERVEPGLEPAPRGLLLPFARLRLPRPARNRRSWREPRRPIPAARIRARASARHGGSPSRRARRYPTG